MSSRSYSKTFRPASQRIFNHLCEHPSGCTVGELISEVYGSGSREPKSAADCIRSAILYANRFFHAHGLLLQIRPYGLNRYTIFIGPKSGERAGLWKKRSPNLTAV